MLNDLLTLMRSELLVTGLIFLLLVLKIGGWMNSGRMLPWIQALLLLNFIIGLIDLPEGNLFGGMYNTNDIILLEKNVLNGALFLISLLFTVRFNKTRNLPEFFILLLSSLLGMFLMISSGHLLMFYLSLELATLPLAALVGFDLDKRTSSEAAMKMLYSSAFSSVMLLFGISLMYGIAGTLNFNELSIIAQSSNPLFITAFIFLFTAFAFKLSIVPFHFWTADVYEGSPMPITAFLSVVSKGGIVFVFMSVLFKVFQNIQEVWYYLIVILAIATMLIGNIFAIRQQNMKRFLAFSSIAQVGFILAGISGNSIQGRASVIFFIIIYIFSNLAAFGVVNIISSHTGSEKMEKYKGLYRSHPGLAWVMALALFSLAGIPPTAGFFGKLFLLSAGAARGNYWFLTFAALNMVISLFYYLKVVRLMFIDKNDKPLEDINLNTPVKMGLIICVLGILLTGFISWIFNYLILVA